jgi:hypothetical protein
MSRLQDPQNPAWRRCHSLARIVVAVFLSVFVAAADQQSKPSEYAVKAAYLYNFAKFVKWPADSVTARNSVFSICILGQDPFGGTLENTVSGETIAGRPATVVRLSTPREANNCSILYIAPSESRRLPEILSNVKESTLTVSDIPSFADRGGMIEFVLESGRVRFQINLTAAQNAGLNVSSELLKVAIHVKER